jgi:hypothetical protein
MQCHQGIESRSGSFEGKRFRHAPHVLRAGLDCSACHLPHEERQPGEIVTFRADGCLSCHHEGGGDRDCSDCHTDLMERTVESPLGAFPHAAHVEGLELQCASCHDIAAGGGISLNRDFCAECHEAGD